MELIDERITTHDDGSQTVMTTYQLSGDTRAEWNRVIKARDMFKDSQDNMCKGLTFKPFRLDIKDLASNKYKTHKPKDKTMWMQTEDKESLVNINQYSQVGVTQLERDGQTRWHIGFTCGFSFKSIKSFSYKEDAVKYLGELVEKLNDEC
jgi:hypothetical protein